MMNKIFFSLSLILSVGVCFTSCNKNKLDELEADLASTKSELNDVKNSNNNNSNLLQTNNPITITTSGTRGFDDAPYNYTSKFDYAYDKSMENSFVFVNEDKTYNFFLKRFYISSPFDDARAYIKINNYDPTSGINDAKIEVYFSNYYAQTDTLASLRLYQDGFLNSGTANDNIVVNSFSFDKSSRQLQVDLTVNATLINSQNSTGNAATTRFQYSGVVSPNNLVYRLAN
jgi:hypothetical protein